MDIIYNVTQREVAVIVARFQIDNLHSAHIELINIILNTHKRIIIVLGLSPLKCTAKNPLDFQMRKQMILDNFKDKHKYITIVYLQDCKTNQEWSDKLDIIIKKNTNNETVRLCGGLLQQVNRDTFKFAMKCSSIKRSGTWQDVYKCPVDAPWKASKAGRFEECTNLLTVFKDGKLLIDYTFDEVRNNE